MKIVQLSNNYESVPPQGHGSERQGSALNSIHTPDPPQGRPFGGGVFIPDNEDRNESIYHICFIQ